jgi:hypothetical protein
MLKSVPLTWSGFNAEVVRVGDDFWIKDASTQEWYFNAFTNGSRFVFLVDGEPCHRIRRGKPVTDKALLERLRQIKNAYVEKHFC